MATLEVTGGAPLTTLLGVASDFDGAPLFLMSTLSRHTRNLAGDPRASLLLTGRHERGDPLNQRGGHWERVAGYSLGMKRFGRCKWGTKCRDSCNRERHDRVNAAPVHFPNRTGNDHRHVEEMRYAGVAQQTRQQSIAGVAHLYQDLNQPARG